MGLGFGQYSSGLFTHYYHYLLKYLALLVYLVIYFDQLDVFPFVSLLFGLICRAQYDFMALRCILTAFST